MCIAAIRPSKPSTRSLSTCKKHRFTNKYYWSLVRSLDDCYVKLIDTTMSVDSWGTNTLVGLQELHSVEIPFAYDLVAVYVLLYFGCRLILTTYVRCRSSTQVNLHVSTWLAVTSFDSIAWPACTVSYCLALVVCVYDVACVVNMYASTRLDSYIFMFQWSSIFTCVCASPSHPACHTNRVTMLIFLWQQYLHEPKD